MKIKTLASLAIATAVGYTALLAAPDSTESAPAKAPNAAVQPVSKVYTALNELKTQIQKKLQAADQSNIEKELAPDFAQFDKIIADNKGADAEELSQVLFMKAMLYLQVMEDFDKGTDTLKRIKTDYPASTIAANIDRILKQIDSMKAGKEVKDQLSVGNVFPDFSSKDIKGKTVTLSQYKGKVVLVDFWATWCPPCVQEIPHVKAAYEKYHSKGFEIVGISLDREESKLTSYIEKNGMPWTQIYDRNNGSDGLAEKYGIQSIPATYLIGADGKIIATDLRGDDLENELAKLLK